MRAVDLDIFLLAAKSILAGHTPYIVGYYNPPWLMALMVPLALLPYDVARVLWFCISAALFYKVAHKFSVSRLDAVAFMLSFPVLASLQQGNIEALVLIGLLLPPPWGNIILAIKPQIAMGVLAYNLRYRPKSVLPLIAITALSIWAFGPWPLALRAAREYTQPWNVAFRWPYLAPMGAWLVWKGIASRQPLLCVAASVLLSPYVGVTSLCVLWLPLLKAKRAAVWLTLISWLIVLILLTKRLNVW